MKNIIIAAALMLGATHAAAQTNDPVKAHNAFLALVEQCSLTSGQYQALGIMINGLQDIMTRDQIKEVKKTEGRNSLYFPDRWKMGDPYNTERLCEEAAKFAGIDRIE